MKEPYGEGIATHSGPESCVAVRKGCSEALTGVRAGWVLSPEMSYPRVPTLSSYAEGNIGCAVIARHEPNPAGSETPCTHGNSTHGNREVPQSAYSGGTEGPRWEPERGTPAMNERGKSDMLIVPKKQSNEGVR